jgi:hypothetical protein
MAMLKGLRLVMVCASAALALPALAQAQADTWTSFSPARPGIGLNPSRAEVAIGCGSSLLPCGSDQASLASLRQPRSLRWSVELAPVTVPAVPRTPLAASRQGLSLSLVGRQPLFGSNFSLYGRLGTTATSAFGDTGAVAPGIAGDNSYGVAFGAGVSMDVTRRLSASFGVDSYDLRAGGAGQVRSTSLGLQYRY